MLGGRGGWEGGKGNMRDKFERNTVPRYFLLPRLNNPQLRYKKISKIKLFQKNWSLLAPAMRRSTF